MEEEGRYQPPEEDPESEKAYEKRRLEGIARNLGLEDRMENPAVRDYVRMVDKLEQIYHSPTLHNKQPWVSDKEITERQEIEQREIDDVREYRSEAEPKPSIRSRYIVVEGLVAAALNFLTHDMGKDYHFDHDYILNRYLKHTLEYMGWEIKPKVYDKPKQVERAKERGNILFPPDSSAEKETDLPYYRPDSEPHGNN